MYRLDITLATLAALQEKLARELDELNSPDYQNPLLGPLQEECEGLRGRLETVLGERDTAQSEIQRLRDDQEALRRRLEAAESRGQQLESELEQERKGEAQMRQALESEAAETRKAATEAEAAAKSCISSA